MRRGWVPAVALGVLGPLLAGALVAPSSAAARTWYVRSGADSGTGTSSAPFSSLALVESASRPGDTIVVLAGAVPLDGGIALKPGQTLRGVGDPAPTLTNTTPRLDGDAVRLADATTVADLRFSGTRRGAVYGLDVTGVRVSRTEVTGHNTSCTPGFLIPAFNAPTNLPGVGVPIATGLQNGWAGIQIDAASRRGFTARIDHNRVHDADCGDGIDVRVWGDADGTVAITDNAIASLRQGPGFMSLLAIGLQVRDRARLVAGVHRNTQELLGQPRDVDFAAHGADSEGVFLNAVGPASLDAVVTGNRYTNTFGWGGFSANGLEMVSMGSGARMRAVVRDSSFSGAPGDLIEHGALGTDAVMDMTLERVTAERSTGVGNTYLLPFNNGDCVLAGSLGARNTVTLTVRRSVLRDCSNNGLSLGSNVVNGSGATTALAASVSDSVITGNRGANVGVRNFTGLGSLSLRIERTDLSRSGGLGSGVAAFSAEDFGSTGTSTVDIGGGRLGSRGGNCLSGGLLLADAVRYPVSARGNWWGAPGGPGPLRTLALGAALDTTAPLAAPPPACR
ncbi:MAG TPA: hypothetical protein VFU93_04925 [Acidimicrobiales bacterium]|nr:hypothetical protein [Acidimicrobiales bacterium]